jgi:rhodanese-related sulfurtransferase
MSFIARLFGYISQLKVKNYLDKYYHKEDHPHILVDIRNTKEYDEGHIEGAINIPLSKLAKRLEQLPKEETIICVGRTGERSREAAHLLQNAGYRHVYNLIGGMHSWRKTSEEIIHS